MRRRRISYFILGVVGGSAAGAGALATWRAVEMGLVVTTKGVDTLAGRTALALSITTIVLVLITRKGSSEEPRSRPIAAVLATGVVLIAIGGLAAAQLDGVYQDTRKADAVRISRALSDEGHETTPEVVLENMDRVERRKPGAGPWILLGGGVLVVFGALSGLAWSKDWRRASAEEAGAEGLSAED